MLGLIGLYIVFGLLLVMLPFFVIGWLLSGWRPFVMSFVLWAVAVFIFHLWAFGWLFLPFQYLLAVAGYTKGGEVRANQREARALGGKDLLGTAPALSDEQK